MTAQEETSKRHGVVFVDVGSKRLPPEYTKEIARPKSTPPATRRGKVSAVIPGSASSVVTVATDVGEVSAVLAVGATPPAIGSAVSVEIANGFARLKS